MDSSLLLWSHTDFRGDPPRHACMRSRCSAERRAPVALSQARLVAGMPLLAAVLLLPAITFDDSPAPSGGGAFGLVNPFAANANRANAAHGTTSAATHGCPTWCETFECDGSAWCKSGERPPACAACGCPGWCYTWRCDGSPWCAAGAKPPVCTVCAAHEAVLRRSSRASEAEGPVRGAGPTAGWVADHGQMEVDDEGSLTVRGDTRAYLVEDYTQKHWDDHRYVRMDLADEPLTFDLDLSGVPCGCLATVYVVAMKDPSNDQASPTLLPSPAPHPPSSPLLLTLPRLASDTPLASPPHIPSARRTSRAAKLLRHGRPHRAGAPRRR